MAILKYHIVKYSLDQEIELDNECRMVENQPIWFNRLPNIVDIQVPDGL